ncbi:TPA: Cna B-type domain-containing protein, partial [Enterococcus faecalis]|nr:Cna B-type domain-containing protein [Enterococcus faecalis]
MILKEIDAPDSVIYDPQKEIVLDIEANNYDVIETIENKEKKVEISGQKTWNDNEDQDGKRPKSITVNLLANGKQVQSKEV